MRYTAIRYTLNAVLHNFTLYAVLLLTFIVLKLPLPCSLASPSLCRFFVNLEFLAL